MTKAAAKKPAFSMATMSNLAAAAGVATNDLMVVRLDDIEPDPDQPRKTFDEVELAGLAESIKLKGVLQPIGLRPGRAAGKYIIVFGERRWRASKIAGKADIVAFQAKADQRDHATQVIENQQRQALSNSEIATAVGLESDAGRTIKEIAAVFNLKEYEVSHYRAVSRFPDFLKAVLDRSDLRGCYDLFRQWEKTPEAVEKGMVLFPEAVRYSDAQRIIAGITGKAANIGFEKLDAAKAGSDQRGAADVSNDPPSLEPSSGELVTEAPSAPRLEPSTPPDAGKVPASPKAAPAPSPGSAQKEAARAALNSAMALALPPVQMPFKLFVQSANGDQGQLITNERAKDAGSVIVLFGEFREEVPAEGLTIVGVG